MGPGDDLLGLGSRGDGAVIDMSPVRDNRPIVFQYKAPPQKRTPSTTRVGVALLVLLALSIAVMFARGWRPTNAAPTRPATTLVTHMPTSAEIEAMYGVRFTLVGVTAGGGMIQVRYQVLNSDKTHAIHSADAAPFVVDGNGVKYADPGMVGHSHLGKIRAAGTTDYILLANAKNGVISGSTVTIKVGNLELRNVPVL